MTKATGLLVVILASASCAPLVREHLAAAVLRPSPIVCADGYPVKILISQTCTDGICGWSCLPNRWSVTP